MDKFPCGSEWRKWDLHVHTPGTAKNDNYGNDAWNAYISKLESLTDTAVFGITDYCSLRNYYRVEEFRNAGRLQGKFILPNIEFRIKPVTEGCTPINLHVLFDPFLSKEDIQREFLSKVTFKYGDATYSCLDDDFIRLGRSIDSSMTTGDAAWRCGIGQFVVDFAEIKKALDNSGLLRGRYLVGVANGTNDGASGIQNVDGLLANRQEIYRMSDFIFSAREGDVKYFLGKGVDNIEKVIKQYGSIKPCFRGSDAHELNKIGVYDGNRATWIKADPTFEGLLQTIIEPEGRVRIQVKSPAFDFEKSPFTKIRFDDIIYPFNGDNEVRFDRLELPLNDGLVSVIGGRGTGKSTLIDYISTGLRSERSERFNYSIAHATVARKVSIEEESRDITLPISDEQNVPFVYISQSRIKNLVANRDEFAKNLRETIGVRDGYAVPVDLREEIDLRINEFYGLVKTVNPNKSEDEKSEAVRLGQEIKKCADFIARVTSEKNKSKLEQYSLLVSKRKNLGILIDQISKLKVGLEVDVSNKNAEIKKFNDTLNQLEIKIPFVDVSPTVKYIEENLLPTLEERAKSQVEKMDQIKQAFSDYTGDLSTLLGQVSDYRERQEVLQAQLNALKTADEKFQKFKLKGFSTLGKLIRASVENYKNALEGRWQTFKHGATELSDVRKMLLDKILNERNLDLKVNIGIDINKMCELLLEGLDHRKFNQEKIMTLLGNFTDLSGFWKYIEQANASQGLFAENIPIVVRSKIIDVFFRKFTEFIRHDVMILSNGKPITKLSHGQQGTIYLRLQIAANLFSETLIYDQPEDDLDNQFITSELVDIFKEIKKYRQVIIVSHNANLVVNSDSEQVVVADNKDGILTYESGSLENPMIRERVCDILEGGREAFARRGKKYKA